MTRIRTYCLAFAALAFANPAAAQIGAINPDLDRDGRVTLSEFNRAQAEPLFERLDKDKDGRITHAEFAGLERMVKRFGGARGAQRIATLWQSDADADGAISRRELEAHLTRRFQAADADHDGVLDKAELKAWRQS